MRNVSRPKEPESLVDNASDWKDALLGEIARLGNNKGKIAKSITDQYHQDDVLTALKSMYGGRCCYCEAQIGIVSYEHIEHRKPKNRHMYPEDSFEWDNLHLACQRCNMSKGVKWSTAAPILDAVLDSPISDHMTYEESSLGLLREALTGRGDTTIVHADLNRDAFEGLPGARAKVLLETMKTIREIKAFEKLPNSSIKARNRRRELLLKTKDDFGSVVAWAIESILDN